MLHRANNPGPEPSESAHSPADAGDRMSLADRATDMLRDRILDLTLEPGLRLDERSLLEMVDVGRTPIREALNRLMSEGLINARGTRGFFVAPMDLENAMQLLDAYLMAERMVSARLRFDHPGLVPRLEILDLEFRNHSTAGDLLNVTAANAAFHHALAEATGNMHFLQFSDHLHRLARRLSYYIYRAEKSMSDGRARLFDQPTEDHRQIIDAIRSEDRQTLIAVMTRHAGLFRSRLSGLIEGTMQPDIDFETV